MKYYFLYCEPIKVSWLAWCKLHWQGFLLAGFLFSLQVSVYAVSSFFCCHRFGFTSLQRLGLLLWPRTRPFASPAGHRMHSILKEDRLSSKGSQLGTHDEALVGRSFTWPRLHDKHLQDVTIAWHTIAWQACAWNAFEWQKYQNHDGTKPWHTLTRRE